MCFVAFPSAYLWPRSWPSACSALVWPPCSSAGAWSGSTEPSGSSERPPETYPPSSCPGRRPRCAHQSPGPAGARKRERCGGVRTTQRRRDKSQKGESWCGRLWGTGLRSCRGTWPGCNVNSLPAAAHTPPGSDEGAKWREGGQHQQPVTWTA